jgi:hypothetical protein
LPPTRSRSFEPLERLLDERVLVIELEQAMGQPVELASHLDEAGIHSPLEGVELPVDRPETLRDRLELPVQLALKRLEIGLKECYSFPCSGSGERRLRLVRFLELPSLPSVQQTDVETA